jgi:hypothetical protein
MDIVTIVILMALFYLVPELLKRRRPKTYEYPEIPDRVPPPGTVPPPVSAKIGEKITVSPPDKTQLAVPPHPKVQLLDLPVAATVAEYSPWQVNLDQTTVVSGIIYAEILQPPRAHRPFRPRGGRSK